MWDLESGRSSCGRWKATRDWVNGVAVTPDGKRAVSASEDNTLKVWDLDRGRRTAHAGRPLGFSLWRGGDGGREAGGFGVLGQDAEGVGPGHAAVELRTLEGHSASVYGVAVTADGKRAVSASGDKTLKVWDLEPRQRAAHARRPLWLASMAWR